MKVREIEGTVSRKELEVLLAALDTCIDAVNRECVVSELSDAEFDKVLTLKRLRYKLRELLEVILK